MSVEEFAAAVAEALRASLGDRVEAVWLIGSLALGDFDPATSDVDVAAAVEGHLAERDRARVAKAILPLAARCPARGLELVLYSSAALADPTRPPEVELNLNAGPRMDTRVDAGPPPGEEHWFVIDLAIAREHGRALYGAPPADLIAPRPVAEIRAALRASMAWHAANRPEHPDTALNAHRARLWLAERRWASKRSAARWAAIGAPGP